MRLLSACNGDFSRAIRADIEKGSRYFRRSDNTPFGRNAAAEVSMTADKRWHGFHLSTIREKFTYISIRRQQATALQKNPNIAKRKSKNALFIPSAHILDSRPPCIYSGRAGNACTNLLGFFVRYVRTRGIAEAVGSGKTTDFRSVLCRTRLPRKARATNSCTREEISKRGERSL